MLSRAALITLIPLGALAALAAGCRQDESHAAPSGPVREIGAEAPLEVEASCGECNFGMAGDGCDLAVRIDGRGYFVEGTDINDHGDSHAPDGFCSAVRRARVVGTLQGETFVARTFELLPEAR
jgi:hypothetical protein